MLVKRLVMTICYRGLRLALKLFGVRRPGVHALVITPEGKAVLIWHSYMPGWYFPGGGMQRGECPQDAILRELREEIGLVRWQRIERMPYHESQASGEQVDLSFFVCTGAEYDFRSSLEIDKVAEFRPDALPEACSPRLRRYVAWWQAGELLASCAARQPLPIDKAS